MKTSITNVGAITSVIGSTRGAAMPADELYLRLCELYRRQDRKYYSQCAWGAIGGGVRNGLVVPVYVENNLFYVRL